MERDALRTLSKGGGILLAGMAFQYGFSFAAEAALARYLGSVDFGVIAFSYSLITLGLTISLLGLETGIARYLPRIDEGAQQRELLLSAFQLSVPAVVLIATLVILGSRFWAGLFNLAAYRPVLQILGAALPLMLIVRLAVGATRGYKITLPKVYLNNIIIPGSRFGLIAIIALLGGSVVDFVWAYVISYALAAIVALYVLAKHTPLFKWGLRRESMRRALLSFSAPLVVSGIMFTLLAKVDTILLGVLTQSSGLVGNYRVIYALSQLLLLSLTAFGFITMPVLSGYDSDGDVEGFRGSYLTIQRWVYLLTIPIFLIFFIYPTEVIAMTFGTEYTAARLGFRILIAGFFVHIVAGPTGIALKAIGETQLVMLDTVTITALNILLNFLLIPRYGISGAATATAVSYTLMNGLYLYQLCTRRSIWPVGTRELRIIVISAATILGVQYFVTTGVGLSGPPSFFATTTIFGILYVVIALRRFVHDQDRKLLRSMIQEIT